MIGGAVARMAALRWREWDNQNLGRILMRHLMNFFRSRAIDMRRRGALTWWEGVLDHRIRGSGPWTESERNGTANSGTTTTADLERTMAAGSEKPTMTDSAKHSNATSVPDNESRDPTDPQEHGDMTYQCDSTLGGAPAPIDCEKLSWSGLKPPDSVETLQAHIPNTYSQGKSSTIPYNLHRTNPLLVVHPLPKSQSRLLNLPRHLRPRHLLHHHNNHNLGPPPRSLRHPLQPLRTQPDQQRQGRPSLLRATSPQLLDQWQAGLGGWC